jgi:hypothetical protein
MPTPSLILVPARFKTGKLYTPVATTSGGLVLGASGDFNVTRATTATRVNANGLIESVASGIPRLDYPLGGGCPALLVEPSAQNGAPNVQYLRGVDTPAASGGLTITTGSTDFLAPDGTSGSITKYVGGAASGATQYAYYTLFSPTTSAAGVYTASLFVKAGTTNPLNFCTLQFINFAGASGTATSYFSLASGTALTSGASIQNYGNGWYRIISAPYTIAAGDLNGNVFFSLAEGNNDINWTASGALNLTAYAWGAQIEAGSVATSYIPTTTAAVTRNADVISVTGAVSGCIGQTEGTIYAEVDYRNLGAAVSIITLQTASYTIGAVRVDTNTLNQIRVQIRDALGSGRLDATFTDTSLSTGINKIAVGYSSNASGVVFALNGSIVATTTVGASFGTLGANRVYLGTRETSASNDLFFNNRIRAAALYTTRLTNAELAALTTP